MLSDLRYRFRALFRRADVEQSLDDEVRIHLECETEKYERAGHSRRDAMRMARLAFGGVDDAKEQSRDGRGTAWVESVWRDVRFAARSLRVHKGFAIAVVVTLALGLGANTAIFSLVNALMLRRIDATQPDRLVSIGDPSAINQRWSGSPTTDYVSYPLYVDLRDHVTTLSDIYANGSVGDLDFTASDAPGAEPEHPVARFVSGNFFAVLGARPELGRTFTAGEDRTPGQAPFVVLSWNYFMRRYSASRAALGTAIRVNGVAMTIVGVMPKAFGSGDIVGQPVDVWLPMMMEPAIKPRANLLNRRDVSWLVLVGRLAPRTTLEQARAEVPGVEARAVRGNLSGIELTRFNEDLAQSPIRIDVAARGLSARRAQYGRALRVLTIAVALVVLVVCANVANLMLARAVTRMREMTVRAALGASRTRLIQQLLAESALLAVIASVFGLMIAALGSKLLVATVSGADRRVELDLSLDARVLAATGAATLLCVLLFGVAPALYATRVDLARGLRAGARNLAGARSGVGRWSTTTVLVVAQIALAVVLLIGGGLLIRSMEEILRTDIGMDRTHLVLAHVATSRTSYVGERQAALQRDLIDRVRRVPGVTAASYSEGGPFNGGHSGGHIDVAGFVPHADSEREFDYDNVGPHYFGAIGARLLRGRDFTTTDVDAHGPVAAVSETFARRYFSGRDPIGKIIRLDGTGYTVIGLVGDIEYSDVRNAPQRRAYFPIDTTSAPRSFEMQIRVRGEPSMFVEPIRRALAAADRTIPLEVNTLDDRVRGSVTEDALLLQVMTCFGALTLALSALGLYGITAYSTKQRTVEFGVRMALGAEPATVTAMVLREATRVAAAGIFVGVPIGILATRLLRRELYGVDAFDVPTLGAAVATLVVTAVVASYLPARRAAAVRVVDAIRGDG